MDMGYISRMTDGGSQDHIRNGLSEREREGWIEHEKTTFHEGNWPHTRHDVWLSSSSSRNRNANLQAPSNMSVLDENRADADEKLTGAMLSHKHTTKHCLQAGEEGMELALQPPVDMRELTHHHRESRTEPGPAHPGNDTALRHGG